VLAETRALIVVSAFVLGISACGGGNPASTDAAPTAPSPTPSPVPVPAPVPAPTPVPLPLPAPLPLTIFSVTLDRSSLFAGDTTNGTVRLSRPAPSDVAISLTSSDPDAVISPRTATIRQNADRATFSVTTSRSISEDRRVLVTASMADTSTTATLQVWTTPRTPTFFTYISDPGEFIGAGAFGRITSGDGKFLATGNSTQITIWILSGTWQARFEAPRGSELAVRRYDNVVWTSDEAHAGLSVSGENRGCSVAGVWFQVLDIAFAGGVVSRFDATFEQRCLNNPASLRGEVRFVG
jgi:hypothetical protein